MNNSSVCSKDTEIMVTRARNGWSHGLNDWTQVL